MLQMRQILSFVIRRKTFAQCRFVTTLGFTPASNFTNEQQQKILDVLNTSTNDQLSCFNITKGRIKSMEVWRKRKGPFKSLDDVLEVDGLGVKVLERLCHSIVSDGLVEKTSNNSKNRKQFVMPVLDLDENFSTAVGFYVGPAGISWAKMSRDSNNLQDWDFYYFSRYPKKMLPTDTYKLAMNILSRIPMGDYYIFEATPNIGMQSSNQATVVSYNQQLELMSMLLALLNTSPKHNPRHSYDLSNYVNNVYYLKANLSARLFRTLMGTERVSSMATIENLLEASKSNSESRLPCSLITVHKRLIEDYLSQSAVSRELLGQALLLTVTFMELCIYKNPISLDAISPSKKL